MTFALSGKWVAKVAVTRRGREANRNEAGWWSHRPSDPLAQVRECAPNGAWLVMRRYPRSSAEVFDQSIQAMREAVQAVYPAAWLDSHEGNFGVRLDGGLVVLDYESFGPVAGARQRATCA